MFFRQIITSSGISFRAAGHMVPSKDDPDVEIESYDYETNTAYPANTVVWYNSAAYISVKDVADDADTPDINHDDWAFLAISF